MRTVKKGYKNLWLSPNQAIDRLRILIEKYGLETVLRKSIFKHEREAWIGGVFLLGLRDADKREWWIEIETEAATPDIYGFFLDTIDVGISKKGIRRNVMNIEIVEWEPHGAGILDLIGDKCKKAYPADYSLLVYVRRGGEVLNYQVIFEELKKVKVPFLQIWILVPSSYDNDYHLSSIYDKFIQIRFNLDRAIEGNKNQIRFATNTGRGLAANPENLGEIEVLLPEIDK